MEDDKDQTTNGGDESKEIDVEAVEREVDEIPDDIPSIPDQLRAIADSLEADDDQQLIVGVVGVDARGDEGTATYSHHLIDPALDDLTAERTLKVIDRYNQNIVENGLKVGLRDALAGPFADMPKPSGIGVAAMRGLTGGPDPDDLGDLGDMLFGGR